MRKLFFFLLVSVIFLSCSDDPEQKPFNERVHEDAEHNSNVSPGIGAIVYNSKYAANQENTPIVNITLGEDTVVYYGTTNAKGGIQKINGFTLYETDTQNKYFFKVDHVNNAVVMESSESNGVFIEIAHVNDTLFSVSAFKINESTKEKTILFERYKAAPLQSGRLKQASAPAAEDELDQQLRDVQKTALTSSHDLGVVNALYELDQAIKQGDVQTDEAAQVQNIIGGVTKGIDGTLDESFLDKLSSFSKTVKDGVLSLLDWRPDFYRLYKILDKFEFTKVEGDQQTVVFGQTPEPLLAALTFDGNPAKNMSVIYEINAGGETKKFLSSSDSHGDIKIYLPETKIEGESTGLTKFTVKVYKGGLINKNTTFTINLKKRPRVSITMDSKTNNQTGNPDEYLKLPLKVQVRDETGATVEGVKVVWGDKTGNGISNPNTYSNEEGITTTSWLMPSTEGQKQAEAVIAENDEYVIVSGKVTFTATCKENDSTEIYFQSAIGTYIVNNYKGNGPNSELHCELKADGRVVFTLYNDPSWPNGQTFGATWGIVKQNGKYYYSESGFWHPAYPNTEVNHPLQYPVTSFTFHNDTVYTK